MKIKNLLITIYVLAITSIPTRIFAQATLTELDKAQQRLCEFDYSLGGKSSGSSTCLPPETALMNALDNIITRLPFYLTALAFFAFLYSAGMYIFALGDATKQETAKKNMMWTATGMIAMALIAIIIKFAGWFANFGTYLQSTTDIPGLTK